MNTDSNKRALGVNPDLKFQSCNMEVNQAFMFQGDGMHNSGLLLVSLPITHMLRVLTNV
jgi:hypothetical protein